MPADPALWSDEPCTRAVSKADAVPAAVPFRLDDLEHVVLSRDDVGGLRGFESDMARHGYWGNGELGSMEVNPPSTCDDMRKHGRIIGFANAYDKMSRPARLLTFSVHLFFTEADARGWVDAYTNGLKASVGTSDGPKRFDARPLDELGPGAVLADHDGPDGVRTSAMFVRGPIVGWVTDLHTGSSNIDVVAAATTMAARIEEVSTDAKARATQAFDAARLLSAPLPLLDYDSRYAGLQWDFFFGGCADTEERASIVGEEPANRGAGFGRLTGCTNMYDPPQDATSSIVRVFSNVQVFNDAQGVSADIADRISRLPADKAERFEIAVGDDSVASVSPPHGDQDFTNTSVTFRIGNIEAGISIQDKDPRDAKAEVTALAMKLRDRIEKLLTS